VLGIPQEAFCIGTIAELHPIKGLQDAISAIGKLHGDTTYAIMGEGEYRKVLARLGGEKMGSNNFILTGYKENASAYLHAFDVFLLPSHSEALGYVLLEAGCARVPVVATRVGGIPEIIHHEHSGRLVDPKNIQQITDALSYVREHPKDALMYSENLYQYVTGEYSLQKMIDSTKGLYETQ
jgi:glycosyltransferase involved in cell wall biosynthesis